MKSVVTNSPGDSAFVRGTFLVLIIHDSFYMNYYVKNKVECVFPVVIWSEFRMVQYRDDDHWEDAPHFIIIKTKIFIRKLSLMIVGLDIQCKDLKKKDWKPVKKSMLVTESHDDYNNSLFTHNVVSANGAVIDNNIPSPKGNCVPFLYFKSFLITWWVINFHTRHSKNNDFSKIMQC